MLALDLVGKKFNRLLVLSFVGIKNGKRCFLCKCDCGKTKIISSSHLHNSYIKSCGCLNIEKASIMNKSHGMRCTPEYTAWCEMKTRCYNKNRDTYKDYGGRGIIVCDRWLNSFENFYLDMGNKPSNKHSLDRINNDGNYEPSNCRWITHIEQCNNRRNNRIYLFKGLNKTLSQISKETGINLATLTSRLNRSKNIEDVIFEPKIEKYKLNEKEYTLSQLAEMTRINYRTILGRLRRGYSVEEAVDGILLKAYDLNNKKEYVLDGYSAASILLNENKFKIMSDLKRFGFIEKNKIRIEYLKT